MSFIEQLKNRFSETSLISEHPYAACSREPPKLSRYLSSFLVLYSTLRKPLSNTKLRDGKFPQKQWVSFSAFLAGRDFGLLFQLAPNGFSYWTLLLVQTKLSYGRLVSKCRCSSCTQADINIFQNLESISITFHATMFIQCPAKAWCIFDNDFCPTPICTAA